MSKTHTSPYVSISDHMWRCLGFRHPMSQFFRNFHARFVDVLAFVSNLLMCRPSCQKCGCRPSCRHFSCKFWKPPRAGEVLPKFSTFLYTLFIFIFSLTSNALSFLQHASGAASNYIGGSPRSHDVLCTPGQSSGS